MTETRTSEFDDDNNPGKKTIGVTEELKDEFSGWPCAGVEDGLSGLLYFGGKDDKGGILGDGFAEKGKKKRRICETGRLGDPLDALGSDIMLMILSCLDARSVALCLLVSCGWRVVASSDEIWSSKV